MHVHATVADDTRIANAAQRWRTAAKHAPIR
jgi:hypothetical protein